MRVLYPANQLAQRRGFSLVEVALAVAVLGLAIVGLFALLPSGISSFQKAMDTSVTAQIAQSILDDAQQTEFDQLIDRANLPPDPENLSYCPENFSFRAPSIATPQWRYFDTQGSEIRPRSKDGRLTPSEKSAVIYQVNTRIRPRAQLPRVNEKSGQVAQVTVQIARNPSLADLPVEKHDTSPECNLIKPRATVPVLTYSGLVGKNQGQ
jgi:uncharacterized protein (TIGR02598 family)